MTEGTVFPIYHLSTKTPEGADTTDIKLHIEPDGALHFDGVYTGPKAEAFWGDWDHEFWLDIEATHAPAVLALILRDSFAREGRLTWSALIDLLTAGAIPFTKGSWT